MFNSPSKLNCPIASKGSKPLTKHYFFEDGLRIHLILKSVCTHPIRYFQQVDKEGLRRIVRGYFRLSFLIPIVVGDRIHTPCDVVALLYRAGVLTISAKVIAPSLAQIL